MIGGADIKEMATLDQASAEKFITGLRDLCEAVRAFPAPVIARMPGWCLGGGLEFAAACDFRDCRARRASSACRRSGSGFPSVIHAALLPRLIGWGRARWLVMTAENIDAANRLGLGTGRRGRAGRRPRCRGREAPSRRFWNARPAALRAQKALLRQWEELPLKRIRRPLEHRRVRAILPDRRTAAADAGVRQSEEIERRTRLGDLGSSAALEFRLALFHEGLDAFLHVLGFEQRQQLQIDVVHVIRETCSLRPIRIMRLAACTASGAFAAISRATARARPISSASGTTSLARRQSRHSRADSVRPVKISSEALAQPIIRGRNQVPPNSGTTPRLTKAAASFAEFRHDANVTAERGIHAVSGGAAVDGANRRLVHRMQNRWRGVAQIERRFRGCRAEPVAASLLAQIEAGAEGAAVAGEDDATHRRILVGRNQQPRQVVQHRPGDRVHALRRVEGDDGNAVIEIVEDFAGFGLLRASGLISISASFSGEVIGMPARMMVPCHGVSFKLDGPEEPPWKRPAAASVPPPIGRSRFTTIYPATAVAIFAAHHMMSIM